MPVLIKTNGLKNPLRLQLSKNTQSQTQHVYQTVPEIQNSVPRRPRARLDRSVHRANRHRFQSIVLPGPLFEPKPPAEDPPPFPENGPPPADSTPGKPGGEKTPEKSHADHRHPAHGGSIAAAVKRATGFSQEPAHRLSHQDIGKIANGPIGAASAMMNDYRLTDMVVAQAGEACFETKVEVFTIHEEFRAKPAHTFKDILAHHQTRP